MYEKYWGLAEKPFENTPDPRFLYHSRQHEEALMRLVYVVREAKGAGMLSGVFGCGKTVLGRALLQELEKDIYRVAFVTNPRLGDVDLLRIISHHLGAGDLPTGINNMKDGKNTVIVIDEAHSIEDKNVFEEIRLILNFQLENKFLLTLLLLGQPELREKIDSNKQLAQRIAMRYHLEALSEEETASYIIHRLKIVKATKPVFNQKAINAVYKRSGGIPRRINQICDMSLFTGFVKKVDGVTEDIIQEAVESLEG
jgi:type II secretory pathway predicted ATPase ExeA